MTITITKPKKDKEKTKKSKQEVTQVDPDKLSMEQLADLYGTLEDQINAIPVNPIYNQFAEVQKELMARIKSEGYDPQDVIAVKGQHWTLNIGAAAKNPRKLFDIAIPMIHNFVGSETFNKIAKVNLSDVDKYLTLGQIEQVVDNDTGYADRRKVTAKFMG